MAGLRSSVILQVARTSLREYARTPEALFWAYGFPLLLALVLGVAFQQSEPDPLRVVLTEGAASLEAELAASPRLQVERLPAVEAERALARGRFDALVDLGSEGVQVRADAKRPEAELARLHVERVLRGPAGGDAGDPTPRFVPITTPGSRYIDFLIPGLIGLNLVGAGLFGVGMNLVQMRVRNLLRRLLVTPMRRSEFFLGFMLSRSLLSLPAPLVVGVFGCVAFSVPMQGSVLSAALVVLVGTFAFSGLGLLVASRARTVEGISGVANLIMLPMWLLGGSLFSNERYPEMMQPLVQALPLTQFNDALREVMLSGAGLADVGSELLAMAAFGVVCFALALRIFRWT